MKQRVLIGLMASLLIVFGAVCFAQAEEVKYPVTIKHKLGETTLKAQPRKVVVMDFGMLDTIDALSLELELALPKETLPKYLTKYAEAKYVDIGGLKEFNLETINAFKPDLIIISARQRDYYAELSKIAPVFFVEIDPAKYLESISYNLDSMAMLFDRKEIIEKALDVIRVRIASVKELAENKNYSTLIILTNDGKISAYGSGSRFGMVHDVLGLRPADQNINVSTHGQLVNYEYIAETNPDLILVVDRSAAIGGNGNGLKMLDNDLVNGTNAAKSSRIVELDSNIWYLSGGGLVSLDMMVSGVEKALQQ